MNEAFDKSVVALHDIHKSFSGVKALRGVTLDVRTAEVLALIGENGAGKSTLMNILGGVHQPDAGSLAINGQPVRLNGVADAMRLGIGFIHQECNVVDNLDVAGYMFLGREPLRGGFLRLVDLRRMQARAAPFLKHLGAEFASDTPVASLSLAQRQLVEIAKALSQEACILIMDEPTSSLTQTEADHLFKIIRDLRNRGVTIIYISHRLGEVVALADRVVALRDGVNAGELTREEITHEAMVRLMVGRDLGRGAARPTRVPEPGWFRVEGLRTTAFPAHEVTFQAARGEILGFAGLVGAGRSEMAHALFGIDHRHAGRIWLGDRELTIRSPRDAIREGLYLAPEDRRRTGLVAAMSVRENITLPDLSRYARQGLIRKEAERCATLRLCREFGIKTASAETPVVTLSGGNQQKVVLARWLAMNPRLMIFDEPTRGVDVGAKAEIYQLMRALAERGVPVLMISSDMEEILGVSDRIVVMHEGRITGVLDAWQFGEEQVMHLAVGGSV
ncbi:MAG: sugar ABC transporter ATP-binding protein [bacterium]